MTQALPARPFTATWPKQPRQATISTCSRWSPRPSSPCSWVIAGAPLRASQPTAMKQPELPLPHRHGKPQVNFSEGSFLGETRQGTRATIADSIERLLASDLFTSGAAIFSVKFGEGQTAGDLKSPSQMGLADLLEIALSGDATSSVSVIIDFVRLVHVAGSTMRAESVWRDHASQATRGKHPSPPRPAPPALTPAGVSPESSPQASPEFSTTRPRRPITPKSLQRKFSQEYDHNSAGNTQLASWKDYTRPHNFIRSQTTRPSPKRLLWTPKRTGGIPGYRCGTWDGPKTSKGIFHSLGTGGSSLIRCI